MRLYRTLFDLICQLVRLNVHLQDELPPTSGPLRWLNVCAALLTIAATVAAFDKGLDQRMHLVAPDAVEVLGQTIGIDLSRRLYGTTGYVGRTEVLHTLFHGGLTGRQEYLDKLGIQYPANAEMPDLLNEAIQKARTLKDLPKDATFADHRLYVPEANDPGLVDYVSWSFDIFGFRIESLYYFYFLVLGISIGLFLICFRTDALPLVALSGLMVAFLILLNSRLFEGVWLRTVHNQRFLTTLCFVPYLHLLFTLLVYRRPTWSRVIATALQVAIFVFVMFTRSSAVWLILSLALIVGLHVVFRLGRPEQETKATKAAKFGLSWPILLLACGVLTSAAYKASTLHPFYSIGISLPYHMVWHNAYMGLALHPDWIEVGDKRDGKLIAEPLTDNMAWMGAVVEAEQRYGLDVGYLLNREIGSVPSWKIGLHEQLIKERFLRFAFQHPQYMLELMLWYKPKRLLKELLSTYGRYDWNAWSLLCPAAFLVIAVMACWRLEVPSHVGRTLVPALAVTGLMSFAAPFWTYPIYHVLGETFLVWTALGLGLTAFVLSRALAKSVARLRAQPWGPP